MVNNLVGASEIIKSHSNCNFANKYSLKKTLGTGTHATVYLSEDERHNLVAVKVYEVTDPSSLDFLEVNGWKSSDIAFSLAKNELEIGSIVDHPHIISIRKVFFDSKKAYVVMDYVEGVVLEEFVMSSDATRRALLGQFLSALEHLFMRNIIPDDLWGENFLISEDEKLTLIDLGGYELLQGTSKLPQKHYLYHIQKMVKALGEDLGEEVLLACQNDYPASTDDEPITPQTIRRIILWIKSLEQKILGKTTDLTTIHGESQQEIYQLFEKKKKDYPDHISFVTAQNSSMLTYTLLAKSVLSHFNSAKASLINLSESHILRYPYNNYPQTLEALFEQYPVCEDYDTTFDVVGSALISASPSLKEKESQESAWGIFVNNERETETDGYIRQIFDAEMVSPHHYQEKIESLIEEAPKSPCGLLYHYFIPKEAPISKAVYLSEPYGIPKGDPLSSDTLVHFFATYQDKKTYDSETQLRLLPSAMRKANGFALNQVVTYRYTTLSEGEFTDYVQKVDSVAKAIFEEHLQEMLELGSLAQETEKLVDEGQKQENYQTLCHRHLIRRDTSLSLYYWKKLEDHHPEKMSLLTPYIAIMWKKDPELALSYFKTYEEQLPHKEQLAVRFAFSFVEKNNRKGLEEMLAKIEDEDLRILVSIVASTRFEEYTLDEYPEELKGILLVDDLFAF